MLIRIQSGLLIGLLAGVVAACRPAAPAQTPTPRPTEARPPAATSTPGLSGAPFSEGLLLAVVRNPVSGAEIYPVDPLTGSRLADYAPIQAKGYFYAFSPDMATLALISFAYNEIPSNGQLHLVSLKDWQDRVFELNINGWVNAMRFSPDGGLLAVAYGDPGSKLILFDTTGGFVLGQTETDVLVRFMKFASDREGLMLYGPAQQRYTGLSTGAPKALLLDVPDLKLVWTAELGGLRDGLYPKTEKTEDLHAPGQAWYFTPGVVFASDRDTLYIVHADVDRLTSVDFELRSVQTVEVRPKLGWFEKLLAIGAGVAHAKVMDGTEKQMAISPDGRRLYVVGINSSASQLQDGQWESTRTPLGLQFIDTEDGGQIAHYETQASSLAISADGRTLYLRGWDEGSAYYSPWTEVMDATSGSKMAEKLDLFLIPTQNLGGRPILVAQRCDSETRCNLAVVLPDSLVVVKQFSVSQYGSWVTP